MSDPRDRALTPLEQRARDAVGTLPAPRPEAAYRARVARAFAHGTLTSAVRTRSVLAAAAPWGAIAAAAALVAVAFALNRGPDWRVIGVTGDGTVTVDGASYAARSPGLARALRRGAHVVLPEGVTLDLVAPGVLAANLDAGTDAVLPAAPNRWWSRGTRGRVTLGNTYFATGRAFHGARLVMDTPEASALVTGTALAVLRDIEGGTCVCVLEGTVRVSNLHERETYAIPAGRRCVCEPGAAARLGPILHSSEHALHRLGSASAELLGR